MELVADVMLATGAFGAAVYCFVLSRRLARFTRLESGMGGAIAVLSAQVDDMTNALALAQATAASSSEQLELLTRRAEAAADRLERLQAAQPDATEADEDTPGERRLRFVRRRSARGTEAAE